MLQSEKGLMESIDLSTVGIVLIVVGIVFLMFSVWQLDLMLSRMVWGPAADRVVFYSDLLNNGFTSMSQMKWTINVWLFPNMKAGIMYDTLMIMNIASSIPIAIGAYLVNKKLRHYKAKVKTLESK